MAPVAARAVGYHVTLRLSDDRGIARRGPALRRAARALYGVGARRGLLAFRVADTHVHALVATDREGAGLFCRYTGCALRRVLGLPVPFEPGRLRPMESERHAWNALRYLMKQEAHHGTHFDPTHDGSSLPDLVGMRVLLEGVDGPPLCAPTTERLRLLFPRLGVEDVRAWLELDDLARVEPALELLPEAAAAAFGLPDLFGQGRLTQLARRAAVHAAGLDGSATQLSALLGVSRRTVFDMRRAAVAAALVGAVQLQLRLRTTVWAARPSSSVPSSAP